MLFGIGFYSQARTHPVGEQESRLLRKVAIVKDEEKFGAIGAESLQ